MANISKLQHPAVIAEKLGALSSVEVTLSIADKSSVSFIATTVYADGADTVTATFATPAGVAKKYPDADSVLKEIVKDMPAVSEVIFTIDSTPLQPTTVQADPLKVKAKAFALATAQKTRQDISVTKLTTFLTDNAGWATGTVAQRAKFASWTAEKVVAVEYQTYLAAVIAANT